MIRIGKVALHLSARSGAPASRGRRPAPPPQTSAPHAQKSGAQPLFQSGSRDVPSGVSLELGPGRALPQDMQQKLEAFFDNKVSFAQVRLHDTGLAQQALSGRGARGVTMGDSIGLASKLNPQLASDLQTLVHEGQHVVQGAQGRTGPASRVQALEREAEQAERAFAQQQASEPRVEIRSKRVALKGVEGPARARFQGLWARALAGAATILEQTPYARLGRHALARVKLHLEARENEQDRAIIERWTTSLVEAVAKKLVAPAPVRIPQASPLYGWSGVADLVPHRDEAKAIAAAAQGIAWKKVGEILAGVGDMSAEETAAFEQIRTAVADGDALSAADLQRLEALVFAFATEPARVVPSLDAFPLRNELEALPLDASSVIFDTQILISAAKSEAGTANVNEEALAANLRDRMHAGSIPWVSEVVAHELESDPAAGVPDILDEGGKWRGLSLSAARASAEYRAILSVLQRYRVGAYKGGQDRSLVADTFFAEAAAGTTPTLATNDRNIYQNLMRIAGQNLDRGRIRTDYADGFDVTINGRTIRVLPL